MCEKLLEQQHNQNSLLFCKVLKLKAGKEMDILKKRNKKESNTTFYNLPSPTTFPSSNTSFIKHSTTIVLDAFRKSGDTKESLRIAQKRISLMNELGFEEVCFFSLLFDINLFHQSSFLFIKQQQQFQEAREYAVSLGLIFDTNEEDLPPLPIPTDDEDIQSFFSPNSKQKNALTDSVTSETEKEDEIIKEVSRDTKQMSSSLKDWETKALELKKRVSERTSKVELSANI